MTRTIIAILALVLSGAIFLFYTKPTYDSLQATQAQIATYNQELTEVGQVQTLAQTLNTQYSSIDPSDLSRLEELLPDHVDNIALILDVSNLASKYGMPLQNVDISTPDDSSGGSTSDAADTSATGASSDDGTITSTNSALPYDSLELTFTTVGSYQNFISLMTDLESSLRVVDLVSLNISAPGATAASSNVSGSTQQTAPSTSPVYQYNITIRTYWLN